MKTKVIDYNKTKAKWKFVQFKLLEIIGAFLFLWGFNPLGKLVYNNYNFLDVSRSMGYVGLWFYGLFSSIVSLFILFIVGLIVWGIIELIRLWIESNWEWAKSTVEDPKSKIERLKEKEKLKLIKKIDEIESDRKNYGFTTGDFIKASKNGGSSVTTGKLYEIKKIWSEDKTVKVMNDDGELEWFDYPNRIQITKKSIPRKPKLNNKYIKRTETK